MKILTSDEVEAIEFVINEIEWPRRSVDDFPEPEHYLKTTLKELLEKNEYSR